MQKINNLLLTHWDPIGVQNTDFAHDEYLQYAHEIYEMIQHLNSDDELFEYLWELETEHMGLEGNRIKTKKAAKIIFNDLKK